MLPHVRSTLVVATGLLVGLFSACRSAESWRSDADDEVYGILERRRAQLGASGEFTVEPPQESLRARLLAQQAEGVNEPLSLDLVDCLRVAAENSRGWQDQRESLFRSALNLTLERWRLSLQPTATASAVASGQPSPTPADPNGRSSDAGFLSNLNLFKLLGIGTQIVGNISLDLLRDIGRGDGWDALSNLSLNITQPILRGFGADIVKEPLTQAERDVLYQARSYERFRRTFAVTIAQSFFLVLERIDRLANEESNLENLKILRERNEALATAGRLTDIQVDQARQDEFSAEDRLVAARRDLEAALDDFKFQLGLPIGTELVLEENGMRTLEAWPALADDLPEEQAIRLGLEKRLDLATAKDQVEDAERTVHVAADALRMGLDLQAGASLGSPEGRPAGLRASDVNWDVSLNFDLPIDRIPERNAYRNSLIALESRRRAASASADEVTSDLRDALRRLDAARASFRIQSGSVVLAERRVESAALNLDAGRASTRDVLEAQASLLSAKNTLAGALTDTILAGLFLYRDMELLEVDDNGIEVLQVTPESATP